MTCWGIFARGVTSVAENTRLSAGPNPLDVLPRFWLAPHAPMYQVGAYNILWENRASLPVLYYDSDYMSEGALPFNCCQLLHEAVLDGKLSVKSLENVGRVAVLIRQERQIF